MQKILLKKEAFTLLADYDLSHDEFKFIKILLGSEVYAHTQDEEKDTITVSRYSNSERFELPSIIFELLEEVREEEGHTTCEDNISQDNFQNEDSSFIGHKRNLRNIVIVVSIVSIAILGNFLFSSNADQEKDLTLPPQAVVIKSDFQLLTEKKNENNLKKAKEYEIQKRLRTELNFSIDQVKKLDEENSKIEKNLIQLAN